MNPLGLDKDLELEKRHADLEGDPSSLAFTSICLEDILSLYSRPCLDARKALVN